MVDKLTKEEVYEILELHHNLNTFELFKKIWFKKMKTFDFSKYTYEYENAEANGNDENINDKRFITLYEDDVIEAYLDNAEPLTIDITASIKFKDISPEHHTEHQVEHQVEHDTYTLQDMYLFRFIISEEDYLNEKVSNTFKKSNTAFKEFYDHVLSGNEYLIGR